MRTFITYCLILFSGFLPDAIGQGQQTPSVSVSVLSIGNQYYASGSGFSSPNGVNESAEDFLNALKHFSTPCILLSSPEKPLTKERILNAISSFIAFVEQKTADQNIGIIYYCGHGMASQAGNRYFVPGTLNSNVFDTTYEALSDLLINLDTIKYMVINAQSDTSRSQFLIMGDCCSEQDFSKWYDGMNYTYYKDSSGAMRIKVEYSEKAIQQNMDRPSIFKNSTEMTFDDLAKSTEQDTSSRTKANAGLATNEMILPGEIIRSMTFTNRMNHVFYSSPMKEKIRMVVHPFSDDPNVKVAPICRRTLLYFTNTPINKQTLNAYFQKIADKDFDTSPPALLDPTMNAGNLDGIEK